MCIFWSVKTENAIKTFSGVGCATATIFNEIINGVNSATPLLEFSGFKGFIFMFSQLKTEINSAVTGPEGTNIKNLNIKTETDKLTGLLGNYYSNWNTATVVSPVDGTTPIKSDVVKVLVPAKITEVIAAEIGVIKAMGEGINNLGVSVDKMKTASDLVAFEAGIDSITKSMTDVQVMLEDKDKLVNDDYNMGKYEGSMQSIAFIFTCVLAGVAIFWHVILLMTHFCKKCQNKCCRCSTKILMVSQAGIAAILCVLGLVVVILAAVTTNACVFTFEAYNDKTFLPKYATSINTTMGTYFTACAYPDATGNIQDAFGVSTGKPAFTETTIFSSGLTEFNDVYLTTYAGKTEPISITTFITLLTNGKAFTVNDFLTEPT
jgi:hypothetical protein